VVRPGRVELSTYQVPAPKRTHLPLDHGLVRGEQEIRKGGKRLNKRRKTPEEERLIRLFENSLSEDSTKIANE